MDKKRIVLAIGGNALLDPSGGKSASLQLEKATEIATSIIEMAEMGYDIVIVHGNGPQVGQIFSAHEQVESGTMPLNECIAMSQGYVGFHLQHAINRESIKRSLSHKAICIITQVEVDANDDRLKNPHKPIGFSVSSEEAELLTKTEGYTMREEIGRGYRRVVGSPAPLTILEMDAIRSLAGLGYIVIAAGGGGIPVIRKNDGYLHGIDAVIDKDSAAEKLAMEWEADALVLLTGVEKVALNYGTPNQKDLDILTVSDVEDLIAANQFEAGSILPKVKAAANFAASKEGRKSVITSLEKCKEALIDRAGTRFVATLNH